MKLWKILLAAVVCVLMLSVVATAECNHQWSAGTDVMVPGTWYSGNDGKHYATYTTVKVCASCQASQQSAQFQKVESNCDYGELKTVAATCSAEGYEYRVCKTCDFVWKVNMISKIDHTRRTINVVEPTCTDGRIYVYGCLYCDWTSRWEDVTAKKPSCEYEREDLVKANCSTKGQWAEVCKYCGTIKNGVVHTTDKDSNTHDWNKTTIDATCTDYGMIMKTCKLCGKIDNDEAIKPLGHRPDVSKQVETKATCTTKGYWSAPCVVCGVTVKYGETPAAHTNKQDKDYKPATCSTAGYQAHSICTGCNTIWDHTGEVISAVPTIPANGKHILPQNAQVVITDCTASNNYREGTCEVCGKTYVREYIPAQAHVFPKATNDHATPATVATCTKDGKANVKCNNCNEMQYNVVIPALGHKWGNWFYGAAATCTTDMVADRYCDRCNTGKSQSSAGYEVKVIEEALGHNWILEAGTDSTCDKDGKGTRVCTRCKGRQNNVTIPAKGHTFTKVVETVKPTCEAQGYSVLGCANCDATQKGNYTAALGHNYQWEVVTKPSASSNGKNEYTCQTCGKVADTKTVKYTNWYYNNTMTSDGPSTRELVGGNDWYRVTPVDLTVDGVYTCDLIASNKYVVGTVTITVNAGTLTVSYSVKGNVDVKDESLLIYTSEANLAAGSAVTAPVGAAINIAETFGGETNVLVSLLLIGDYDAAGKTVAAN